MRGAEPRRGQRGGGAHREECDHDRGGAHRHHADTGLHHQDGVRGGQGQKYLKLRKKYLKIFRIVKRIKSSSYMKIFKPHLKLFRL